MSLSAEHSRRWFITGAGGEIGRTLVLRLLAQGDRVAALTTQVAAFADITGAQRQRLIVGEGSPSDSSAVHELANDVGHNWAGLDVVVNNAGYLEPGRFEDLSEERLRAQFEVNFFAAASVTRAALPLVRTSSGGCIVFISSVAGQIGVPGMTAYSASKHALEGLAVGLAEELGPEGISVMILQPGATGSRFRRRWTEKTPSGGDELALRLSTIGSTPDPNAAHPSDVAGAILSAVNLSDPPLRLPLSSSALELIRAARERQIADFAGSAAVIATGDGRLDPTSPRP